VLSITTMVPAWRRLARHVRAFAALVGLRARA
jgi:hypothetical protein